MYPVCYGHLSVIAGYFYGILILQSLNGVFLVLITDNVSHLQPVLHSIKAFYKWAFLST